MKILNLYAGIGGNRKLWGDEHEVTAVENDELIAKAYEGFFPNDDIFIEDAHEHLINYFENYDFIWSSPPCPSHGQYRFNEGYAPLYPDMKLYEEIIFLKHHFKGKWVVENVKPYYKPLIKPTVVLQRHLIWSNFDIPAKEFPSKNIRTKNKISDYDYMGLDIKNTKIKNKRQVMRNCVSPELGKYILESLNE